MEELGLPPSQVPQLLRTFLPKSVNETHLRA